MLEGFSAPARHAVALATAEARRLRHPRVGTEHLLLGLLAADGTATALLRAAGASLAAVRHKVGEVVTADPSLDGRGEPELSPRAQRALERAGRFSRQRRASAVETEHVLLGVLDVEGLASQVLRGIDVDLARLEDALAVQPVDDEGAAVADDAAPPASTVRPRCPGCGAALDDTLAATPMPARRDSGAETTIGVVFCAACGTAIGVVPTRA